MILEFLQNNWGKISALAVAASHAIVLHRREIAATNEYLRKNGGIFGLLKGIFVGEPKNNLSSDLLEAKKLPVSAGEQPK